MKMMFAVDLPENAKVEVRDGKAVIAFDTKETKRDLWEASFGLWLVHGGTAEDFQDNQLSDYKRLEVSSRYKLKLAKG